MYEYEQKIWSGKKWEPTFQLYLQDKKYSETNDEKIVDFANLTWIECLEWCHNNIEYVEIKQTWRKELKIKIDIGNVFSGRCITVTKKNYKKFKIGTIYTKVVSPKDKQQELIDNYIKNN